MRRSQSCDFCVSPQPPLRTERHKRLGRMVAVCSRHAGSTEALTPRQRETAWRRMTRLAMGGT